MEAGFTSTRVYPRCVLLSLGMLLLQLAKKSGWARQSGEWVYELFITTLPVDGFLVEDVLDLYHGRGAEDCGALRRRCGRRSRSLVLVHELWKGDSGKLHANGCGTCVTRPEKMMQGAELREIEWAAPKEATLLLPIPEPTPEEYGPWQLAGDVGRARGQIGGSAFVWQEDGKLRCPAGASLWLSEVRQENEFTQRAVYLAYQTDCQRCARLRAVPGERRPKATELVG
jgi:hypothetical protein